MPDEPRERDRSPEPKAPQRLIDALADAYTPSIPVPPEVDRAIVARAQRHFARHRRARMILRLVPVGMAAAACLALLVFIWPSPAFDADTPVAALMGHWSVGPPSAVRGDSRTDGEAAGSGRQTGPLAEPAAPQAWIKAALAEEAVKEALATHDLTERRILVYRGRGLLHLDPQGQITLADGVTEAEVRRRGLDELLKKDQAACRTIIDALIRHAPGATANDRPRLTQALNRWRAKQVFGRD